MPFSKFKLGTGEQLVRIGLNAAGAALFGAGVAQGAEFQAAAGGLIAIGQFAWWMVRNKQVQ